MFFKLILTFSLLSISSVYAAFPEMPFCPFGGAPGWWNRLSNNYNQQAPMYPMPYYQTPKFNANTYPRSSAPSYTPFHNNNQQQKFRHHINQY